MAFFGIGGSNKKTNVSEGVVHDSKQDTDEQSHDILAEFEAQFSNQGPMPAEQPVRPIPETVHSQPGPQHADHEEDIPDFDIDFHPSEPVNEPARPVQMPTPPVPPRAPISVPEPERPRHELPPQPSRPPVQSPPQGPPAQPYRSPAQPPYPPQAPPRGPVPSPMRQAPPSHGMDSRPRAVPESLPDFDLPDFASSFDERPRSEPDSHDRWDFTEAFAQPERAALRSIEQPHPSEPARPLRGPVRSEPMRAPEPVRDPFPSSFDIPHAPEPVRPRRSAESSEPVREPIMREPPRHYDIVMRDGALFIEKNELARHLSDLTALRTVSSSTKRSFDEIDTIAKDEKKLFTKMQTIVRSLQESLEEADTLLFSGDQ